jgi:hypothetical protein
VAEAVRNRRANSGILLDEARTRGFFQRSLELFVWTAEDVAQDV